MVTVNLGVFSCPDPLKVATMGAVAAAAVADADVEAAAVGEDSAAVGMDGATWLPSLPRFRSARWSARSCRTTCGRPGRGAGVLASLTALSQTDRTAPDLGINTGHPARC